MAAVQYVNVQHTKFTRVHLCIHHKLYTKVLLGGDLTARPEIQR